MRQRMLQNLLFIGLLFAAFSAYAKPIDSKLVLGPEECAECHKAETSIWRNTHHALTFKEMPRNKDAKVISKALNIRRIKTSDTCANCHFTRVIASTGKEKAIAGIACESCHGAAKNWLDLHNDYGGKDIKAAQESAAHKAERIANAENAGMIRPGNLYAAYSNCYQCHTVDNEKLVNGTEHKAGSDFELVSWSSGEIRHNVFESEGQSNPEDSPAKKRVKYVLGQALDLEYALRGLAKATADGKYADAMVKRAKNAIEQLKQIDGLASIEEVKTMLAAVDPTSLKSNNASGSLSAANKVATSAKQFASKQAGDALAALDKLLPSKSQYKGTPKQ